MKSKIMKILFCIIVLAVVNIPIYVKAIENPVLPSGGINVKEYISGNYAYSEYKDGTVTLKKYNGTEKNVIIPSSLDGKKVVSISTTCFLDNSNINSITIPDTVLSIDTYAFRKLPNLTTVKLSNEVVKMDEFSFYLCPKLKLNIPNTLTFINDSLYRKVSEVTAQGEINYDLARQVFEKTNEEREKLGLEPFEYCQDLCDIAMERATEISIYYGHIRPIGGDTFTISSLFDAENVGFTTATLSTASHIVESWMNSPMHRVRIVDPELKSIGIGAYKVEGHTFWVQIFSKDAARKVVTSSGKQNLAKKVQVASGFGYLNNLRIDGIEEDNTIEIGETLSPKNLYFLNDLGGSIGVYPRKISLSDLSWTSSNENIFTVDENGAMTAKSVGTAKLIASIGNFKEEYNITVQETIPEGTTMHLDKRMYQINGLNDTVTLNAILSTGKSTRAEWSSENTKIATVDQNGKVTPVNGGFVYITAKTPYGTDKCYIYVCALRTLSSGERVYPGDLDGSGAINSNDVAILLDWSNRYYLTDDEIAIADINCDGVVNSNDAANLSNLANSLAFSPGKYNHIQTVSLNKSTITLDPGDMFSLTASISPEDHTDIPTITWKSTNSNVVAVDQSGNITAKMAGTATIRATSSNGKYSTCIVTVTGTYVPIDSVTLNRATLVLDIGRMLDLKATISPTATSDDPALSWSSSNTSVATVTSYGRVLAKAAGTAIITVTTVNGKTDMCIVTVKNSEILTESVALNKTNITLEEGKNETLTATISPSNHTDSSTLNWQSSKTDVATVDSYGNITAKKEGTAIITVATANGKTATCIVTVSKKQILTESVKLNKSSLTLEVGKSNTLLATISPSNHTDSSTLNWQSSKTDVATIDSNGKIIAKKEGTSIITVITANGKTATCTVTVIKKSQRVLKGDMNKDGKVNATDAAMILDRYKYKNATEEDMQIGDINNDEKLNATDAALVLDIYKGNGNAYEVNPANYIKHYKFNTEEVLKDTGNMINLVTYTFCKPSSSMDFVDENGYFNNICVSDNNVYWTRYDNNMNRIFNKSWELFYNINKEENSGDEHKILTYNFGNAIYYQGNLYVMYSRYTSKGLSQDEYKNEKVMAMVKYDRNGNVVTTREYKTVELSNSYSVGDINYTTSAPFYTSNCSLATNNGVIACFYGRNIYMSHQTSALIFIDPSTLEIISDHQNTSLDNSYWKKYYYPYGHNISHSLGQRIIPTSDGQFLMMESGDAGTRGATRGLMLTKLYEEYDDEVGESVIKESTKKVAHYSEGSTGANGYNCTYSVLGNIIELDDGYMYIGALDKNLNLDYGSGIDSSWNVFAQKYDKDFYKMNTQKEMQLIEDGSVRETIGQVPSNKNLGRLYLQGNEIDYGFKWLTNLDNTKTAILVRAVKIKDDNIVILWEENKMNKNSYGGYYLSPEIKTSHYMIIDKYGDIIVKDTVLNNTLISDEEQYVYKDGKIYWTTATGKNKEITVNVLDVDKVVEAYN